MTETGLYRFERLLPGDYEIRQISQDGWVRTTPAPAPAHQVALPFAGTVTDVDFGNQAAVSEIRGQKWYDQNADGQRDAGEAGVDGVVIELVDPASGQVVDSTVTASVDLDGNGQINPVTEAGLYSFEIIHRGRY